MDENEDLDQLLEFPEQDIHETPEDNYDDENLNADLEIIDSNVVDPEEELDDLSD